MQEAAFTAADKLLTARQVQTMLEVDRSTVYRMAEDGRLPAIKVGRQWRFPHERIIDLLHLDTQAPVVTGDPDGAVLATGGAAPGGSLAVSARGAAGTRRPASTVDDPDGVAMSVLQISADLLGVMMVLTDMDGQPLTPVVNRCAWFAERADDPEVVAACAREWQAMADDPDFAPHFHTGVHGFQCARAFIRSGSALVGQVLAGGIAPPGSDGDGFHHLDETERLRVLRLLPKVAAALCRVAPRPAPTPDRRRSS